MGDEAYPLFDLIASRPNDDTGVVAVTSHKLFHVVDVELVKIAVFIPYENTHGVQDIVPVNAVWRAVNKGI